MKKEGKIDRQEDQRSYRDHFRDPFVYRQLLPEDVDNKFYCLVVTASTAAQFHVCGCLLFFYFL